MSADKPGKSRLIRAIGVFLAATGVAHFTNPNLFDPLTGQAFPRNTRQHTYFDGGAETAIGLALLSRRTRKLAVGGSLAYLAGLGVAIFRNNR